MNRKALNMKEEQRKRKKKKTMKLLVFAGIVAAFIFILAVGISSSRNGGDTHFMPSPDHPLIGVWGWTENEDWTFVFDSDGTGSRGDEAHTDYFVWAVNGRNVSMTIPEMVEFWTFEISQDEILTISSRQIEGMTLSYIRLQ